MQFSCTISKLNWLNAIIAANPLVLIGKRGPHPFLQPCGGVSIVRFADSFAVEIVRGELVGDVIMLIATSQRLICPLQQL